MFTAAFGFKSIYKYANVFSNFPIRLVQNVRSDQIQSKDHRFLHIQIIHTHTHTFIYIYISSSIPSKAQFYFTQTGMTTSSHNCIKFLYFYIFSNRIPQYTHFDSNPYTINGCCFHRTVLLVALIHICISIPQCKKFH